MTNKRKFVKNYKKDNSSNDDDYDNHTKSNAKLGLIVIFTTTTSTATLTTICTLKRITSDECDGSEDDVDSGVSIGRNDALHRLDGEGGISLQN